MVDVSQPPPSRTLAAAAAGGFGGAVLGVIAATALTGNGDNPGQGNVQPEEPPAIEQEETRVAEK